MISNGVGGLIGCTAGSGNGGGGVLLSSSLSTAGDEIDSRGSASPKSYTSHSSLEDKFPSNIRMAPIPEGEQVEI